MAARSVLVSIAVLVICSCYGCSGGRGTEGQPGATQGEASGAKTSPRPAGKAKKLALLVGINKYKAVNGLSGCVADVRNMQGLLRGKFDFPDDSIRVLTDEQATHAAIVQAFKDHLIGRAADNAVVVFHYSGHGSRMKDPTGKSPSGEISTIVPHDSRTEGVYDISADELRGLFSLLAEKTKNVTFIFDSCHSGMVLKDVATARARVDRPGPARPAAPAARGTARPARHRRRQRWAQEPRLRPAVGMQGRRGRLRVRRPDGQPLRHSDTLLRRRGARLGQGRSHLSRRHGTGQSEGYRHLPAAAPATGRGQHGQHPPQRQVEPAPAIRPGLAQG